MIMHLTISQPRPSHALLLTKHSQNPKDNRNTHIKLQPHQPMRNRIRNIFKMHRLALDKYTNCNYRIERLAACTCTATLLGEIRRRARK